jgi:hypothetical protein
VGDTWDLRMTQTMLASVLDGQGQQYLGHAATGVHDADTTDAVKRFQSDAGLTPSGDPDASTRKVLYGAYMDWLCTPAGADAKPYRMQVGDFLGGAGAQPGDLPKMSLQSCGKLNPIVLLTTDEMGGEDTTDGASKVQRNADDAPNRRVIMFLFEKGTTVDTSLWPCPQVKETNAACKDAFWPDGDDRRKNGPTLRLYEKTRDTMACRFYDRFARRSPCEGAKRFHTVIVVDEHEAPISGVKVLFEGNGTSSAQVTDAQGCAKAPMKGEQEGLTVRIGDLNQLNTALRPLLQKPPRGTTLPTGDNWAFRTPRKATQDAAAIPNGQTLYLMIVTRLDVIVIWPNGVCRNDLEVADPNGPWTFVTGDTTKLSACATGLGAQAKIVKKNDGSAPPPSSPPPFPQNPVWRDVTTYVVQPGDTFEKLAAVYLGDASRSSELRQDNPSVGSLTPGQTLVMPAGSAPSWVSLPQLPASTGQGGAATATGGPLAWATIALDDLLEALFAGQTSTLTLPLDSLTANDSASWPEPLVERVLAYTVAIEMAQQGTPLYSNVQNPPTG